MNSASKASAILRDSSCDGSSLKGLTSRINKSSQHLHRCVYCVNLYFIYPSTDSSATYFGRSIMPVKISVAFVGCVWLPMDTMSTYVRLILEIYLWMRLDSHPHRLSHSSFLWCLPLSKFPTTCLHSVLLMTQTVACPYYMILPRSIYRVYSGSRISPLHLMELAW